MRAMIPDPFVTLRDRVFERAIEGEGESEPTLRRAAADGSGLPDDLQALIEKIHSRAYLVSDDDIARLRPIYGDDRLFEIVVSAALGASLMRLTAGLKALAEA